MSYAQVWAHTRAVVDVLDTGEIIRRFQRTLNLHHDDGALGDLIASVASVGGMLRSQPTAIAERLPGLIGQVPPGPSAGDIEKDPRFLPFLADAAEYARAITGAVEWLRAQLPGYPQLLVPHLDAESPHSDGYAFMGEGFPWTRDARQTGLHFGDPPPVGRMLRAKRDPQGEMRALRRVLMETPRWQSFVAARRELDSDARVALRAARRRMRVEGAAAGRAAGELVLRDRAARRAVLAEIVEDLRGPAREYVDAFGLVNALIDDAARILSQWLAGWLPVPAPKGASLEADRRGDRWHCRIRDHRGDLMIAGVGGFITLPVNPLGLEGVMIYELSRTDFANHPDGSQTLDTVVEGTLLPDSAVLGHGSDA